MRAGLIKGRYSVQNIEEAVTSEVENVSRELKVKNMKGYCLKPIPLIFTDFNINRESQNSLVLQCCF